MFNSLMISVADPHQSHFDADADRDPDFTFHSGADPAPTF
jgi:hypothetical protein